MRNRTHTLRLLIFTCAFISLIGIASAVTWKDDFNQQTDENWKLQGNDSQWRYENGFLRTKIDTKKQWRTIFELYQFTTFAGPYNDISIKVENIGVSEEIKFGIAIGKYFFNEGGEVEEIGYYLFLTNDMQTSRNSRVFLGPGKRWTTDVLNEMTLHINSGRFQLFGDGESRMDFIDANLTYIDIIGFVLIGYVNDMESTGEAWVDNITISGLSVSPKDKLTTIWGHLKRE